MRSYVPDLTYYQRLNEVQCNKCASILEDDHITFERFIIIKHRFGYGSKLDTKEYELDLCEDCFLKFCFTLKVPPKITQEN